LIKITIPEKAILNNRDFKLFLFILSCAPFKTIYFEFLFCSFLFRRYLIKALIERHKPINCNKYPIGIIIVLTQKTSDGTAHTVIKDPAQKYIP